MFFIAKQGNTSRRTQRLL